MARKDRPAKLAKQGGRKARGKAPANPKWWEQAEDVPRSGLPDAEQLTKKAKRLRRLVWASVVLCPLLILTSVVGISAMLRDADPVETSAVDQYGATKADAVVAIRQWLAQDPAPLPGGVLVNWNSAETAAPTDPEASHVVEVHHLTVASPGGLLYDTTVTLGVDEVVGAAVIGEPSLVPRPPSVGSLNVSPWPGHEEDAYQPADAVTASIASWADAYSSGNPDTLRLYLQDPSESRSYMPLVGATLAVDSVGAGIALWGPDASYETKQETAPSRVVVQARFRITWAGHRAANAAPAVVTYDLLVERADTAAPVVVAWGGAGTGPELEKYGNAVVGDIVVVDPADAEGTLTDEQLPEGQPQQPKQNKKKGNGA